MRKIKEVLRLKHECGISKGRIAFCCSISRSTVSEYIKRADKAGIGWPLPDGIGDDDLDRLLFPPSQAVCGHVRPAPDLPYIHTELKRKGVTLYLLWEEYKEGSPGSYQYSRFCDIYRQWTGRLDASMRQVHKAGEKMFVDYCGQTVEVIDRTTGEICDVQIFVSVLGASNYTYAEATWTQSLSDWIGSHVRAFIYFGGCSEIVVPDNLKSGVPNRAGTSLTSIRRTRRWRLTTV